MTAARRLTRIERGRSLAAIIASATVFGFSFGVTMPLLTLVLDREGVDTMLIGLNTAVASLAILLAGPFYPRVIGVLGMLPSLYLGIAGSASVLLLLGLWIDVIAWFPLRFMFGLLGGLHWIASESWINTVVTSENRGRVIGIYVTTLASGFALGPLMIGVIGTEGWLPFVVSAALILAGACPLLAAGGLAPPMPRRPPIGVTRIARLEPIIMAAALLGGMIGMSVMALYPLYALHSDLTQDTAVVMLTVFLLGNFALQFPLGWLADRWDARRLIAALAIIGVAGPVALPFALGQGHLVWPLLFVWGGAMIGFYTVGLTLLGQRFRPAELTAANAAFVMVFELGSFTGPIVTGAAMDLWDPHGFSAALAIACGVFLAIAAAWHRPRSDLRH